MHTENSEMPFRQVLIRILSDLPDFLPGDNLLLVTGYIVEEWGRLQKMQVVETA